eukprot:CAMPEP_0205927498 /NCGR_PEP_ID=MMETSP1325-20131115/22737_1 /ASSEMBLY_ACC=CAM_ASM_000708 /TAXON_ID=236786 /ORGANISM="Florenciella sp., Strain RCC1007" /LENGTH=75 /DNA_ID=CAMNT_0053296383 /DNA_START=429 /DNA_END=657 /DNA_ORIENTATION=-
MAGVAGVSTVALSAPAAAQTTSPTAGITGGDQHVHVGQGACERAVINCPDEQFAIGILVEIKRKDVLLKLSLTPT